MATISSEPWLYEPDYVEWESVTGLWCHVRRNTEMGHLCGYVDLFPAHPLHGKGYDEIELDIHPHGGLTYAAEAEGRWRLGFDCAHLMTDRCPGMEDTMKALGIERSFAVFSKATYKDIGYVIHQCEQLAQQLKDYDG